MKRVVTRDQFEWAIFQGKIGAIKRSHLELFDYDPPTLRAAVVSLSETSWTVVKMVGLEITATRRFRAMHDFAMALLGEPPWRCSLCVTTYGRLGFLEKTIADLPLAASLTPYSFPLADGRAMCRPDEVDYVEDGLPLPPPGDRQRVAMMSDKMRWRKVYDVFVEEQSRMARVADRERRK